MMMKSFFPRYFPTDTFDALPTKMHQYYFNANTQSIRKKIKNALGTLLEPII